RSGYANVAPGDTRSVNRYGHGPLSAKFPINVTVPSSSQSRYRSEIRLVRHRDAVVEQVAVALGADFLDEIALHPPITPRSRPWLVVGVRVLHREGHFHRLAAVDHAPALDHAQLLGMRRAIVIDEGLGVQPDGVDHKSVALVVPHRLAVP